MEKFLVAERIIVFSDNSCKKFGSSGKVSKFQRASKNSIRFTCTVKEKRSDAKKALHNLLFHTKGSRDFLQLPFCCFEMASR
ncbi:unnamed protein product [Arabidopsis lyrata]|nr:unnamed protein product [Arabidopsis lyrata]